MAKPYYTISRSPGQQATVYTNTGQVYNRSAAIKKATEIINKRKIERSLEKEKYGKSGELNPEEYRKIQAEAAKIYAEKVAREQAIQDQFKQKQPQVEQPQPTPSQLPTSNNYFTVEKADAIIAAQRPKPVINARSLVEDYTSPYRGRLTGEQINREQVRQGNILGLPSALPGDIQMQQLGKNIAERTYIQQRQADYDRIIKLKETNPEQYNIEARAFNNKYRRQDLVMNEKIKGQQRMEQTGFISASPKMGVYERVQTKLGVIQEKATFSPKASAVALGTGAFVAGAGLTTAKVIMYDIPKEAIKLAANPPGYVFKAQKSIYTLATNPAARREWASGIILNTALRPDVALGKVAGYTLAPVVYGKGITYIKNKFPGESVVKGSLTETETLTGFQTSGKGTITRGGKQYSFELKTMGRETEGLSSARGVVKFTSPKGKVTSQGFTYVDDVRGLPGGVIKTDIGLQSTGVRRAIIGNRKYIQEYSQYSDEIASTITYKKPSIVRESITKINKLEQRPIVNVGESKALMRSSYQFTEYVSKPLGNFFTRLFMRRPETKGLILADTTADIRRGFALDTNFKGTSRIGSLSKTKPATTTNAPTSRIQLNFEGRAAATQELTTPFIRTSQPIRNPLSGISELLPTSSFKVSPAVSLLGVAPIIKSESNVEYRSKLNTFNLATFRSDSYTKPIARIDTNKMAESTKPISSSITGGLGNIKINTKPETIINTQYTSIGGSTTNTGAVTSSTTIINNLTNITTPPFIPPFIPPVVAIPRIPDFGGRTTFPSFGSPRFKIKQPKGYTPTLRAAAFGLTGSRNKWGETTGLGERYILSSKKKETKKKKRYGF